MTGNVKPNLVLIKPGLPRPDLDRHVFAERSELEALQFLKSWCRASKRLAAQRRRSDAEEKTPYPDTPTLLLQSRTGRL